jgi:hypothetical protein
MITANAHLSMHATVQNTPVLLPLNVVLLVELGEAPIVRLDNLLAASKLEFGSAECLNGLHI